MRYALSALAATAVLALAADVPKRSFDVPAGAAERSLRKFSEQAGVHLIFPPDITDGIRTRALKGEFTVADAANRLLEGTRLELIPDEKTNVYSIARVVAAEKDAPRTARPPASDTQRDSLKKNEIQTQPPPMKKNRLVTRLAAALALFVAPAAHAQQTGIVTGRVLNVTNDMYLETARVTIEGTTLEAYTDSWGTYRLTNVPAGVVTIKAFHTGLLSESHTVTVDPGQTVRQDFRLTGYHPQRHRDGTVVLDQFVVSAAKEMDGAAIAINEQRFAPNFKNVVSADEFGDVPDGNVADFMKYLPGVTVTDTFGDARTISLDGAPPSNVPVSFGGFDLANTVGGGTVRTIELEHVSLNNVARVEVNFTPTPEVIGSALAGSVNMVPRSAFERSKPHFSWSTYLMMRDNDRSFGKTPGARGEWNKINPGFDFSYIKPVNDRFGFTFSGGHSTQYSRQDFMQTQWRGGRATTNGGTFPDTTPDNPYLTEYQVRDGAKLTSRTSLASTIDYRVGPHDRLSFAFQWGCFSQEFINNTLSIGVTRVLPGDFGPTFTHGAPGGGALGMNSAPRDKDGTTYSPNIRWWHDGPIWKMETGLGYSRATHRHTDISKGYFRQTNASRSNVTVRFDDITSEGPRRISVSDGTTGAPLDPYDVNNYFLSTATTQSNEILAEQRSAFANVRRDFFGRIPLSMKAGLDFRHMLRDNRRPYAPQVTYLGPDGVASQNPTLPASADNNAGIVYDPLFSQRTMPFGFPSVRWLSSSKLWDLYNQSPGYFRTDEAGMHNTQVSISKHFEELISAAYIRGDMQLFRSRLKLVGGLRAEQTNAKGEGALVDLTRNFQRDAAGNIIRAANGTPLPITNDPLEMAKLTRIDRGLRAKKEYLRWFPSLNASFDITEQLKARAGHYWSIGRPRWDQYAGSLTLPNTDNPPSASNRMAVNNAGIKAWDAKTTKVGLEYYFQRVGTVSVSAFRRDLTNVFGSHVMEATPAFLALYGLDPNVYGDYGVSTQYNIQTPVRMTGVTFSYKQQLTFLPEWARGVQVFANASDLRVSGADTNLSPNFFIPRSASWGVSLGRPKFTLRANWTYREEQGRSRIAAGRSIDPGTTENFGERVRLDLAGEYRFHKSFALFATMQNVFDDPEDQYVYGPNTAAYARLKSREQWGSLWTIGLKGSF